MGSLSEFTAELRKSNVARPNLYYVEIFMPGKMYSDSTQYNTNMINMYCSGASTPHLNMFTNDDYNEGGTKRKYIYDYDYQPLLLQFYVDQKYDTKNFFDNWMKRIVPSERKFSYYEDYVSPLIRLTIINTGGQDTYQYVYANCVPKTISNIDLTYSATGSISTFNVEFVFETVTYYKIEPGKGAIIEPPKTEPDWSLSDNPELLQLAKLV